MSVINRWLFLAALAAAVVLACGPFFGLEVLEDRKAALLAAPSVSFENELKALAAVPQDKLPVVEFEVTRETVEGGQLSPRMLEQVKAMRAQADGEAAYGLGDGLDAAIRHYTAGAVSFVHGETRQARAHFQAVLALPEGERRKREVWVHFMLGRNAVLEGDEAGAVGEFQATRGMVRRGAADPLGLAVASLGEEARVLWNRREVGPAVNLYAQQAAYGSTVALDSLVTVAGLILKDKDLLDQAMQDPLARRLVFLCLNKNNGRTFFVGPGSDNDSQNGAATVDDILAAMQRHNLTKVAGAGLLAAAAYNQGRYDVAEKMAAREDVPISEWVKAKLALRGGDRTAAMAAYDKALAGFETGEQGGGTVLVLRGESGVLRVSRGDYSQALDLFYRASKQGGGGEFADYWGDAAYLAERVLTLAELREYVDHNVPAELADKSKKAEPGSYWWEMPSSERLRSLLARRMMRAGMYAGALHYFDNEEIRKAAQEYGVAVESAGHRWWLPSKRAEALFRAATLARTHGLEILGYEREPDYAMWAGEYVPYDFSEDPDKLRARPMDGFDSEDERKRVQATKPERGERFHYRYVAAGQAAKAADLLPERSQAFAAVLCAGTSWVIDRDPQRAEGLYARYVKHGALVRWGRRFGKTCPQPDFSLRSVWSVDHRARALEGHAKAHKVLTGAAGAGALLWAAGLIYLFGRRRS